MASKISAQSAEILMQGYSSAVTRTSVDLASTCTLIPYVKFIVIPCVYLTNLVGSITIKIRGNFPRICSLNLLPWKQGLNPSDKLARQFGHPSRQEFKICNQFCNSVYHKSSRIYLCSYLVELWTRQYAWQICSYTCRQISKLSNIFRRKHYAMNKVVDSHWRPPFGIMVVSEIVRS